MVRSIYLYTNYKKVAGSKQTLYHSFYSLARNSICADLFICLVHCLNLIVKAQIEPSQFIVPVLCLLLLLILRRRCIRFRCLFLESIYCDFLILYEDQKRRNNLHWYLAQLHRLFHGTKANHCWQRKVLLALLYGFSKIVIVVIIARNRSMIPRYRESW